MVLVMADMLPHCRMANSGQWVRLQRLPCWCLQRSWEWHQPRSSSRSQHSGRATRMRTLVEQSTATTSGGFDAQSLDINYVSRV